MMKVFACKPVTGLRVAFVSLALGFGALSPAYADEGDSYLCEINTNGPFYGTVPEIVAFRVGTDDGGTLVFDPFIKTYYGEPIEAELLVDNDKKVAIRWTIKFVAEGTTASAKLQYEVTYFKAQNNARLRARQPYGDTKEPTFPAVCKRGSWE